MNGKTSLNWVLGQRSLTVGLLGFLVAFISISCASDPKTIAIGVGKVLDNVSASVTLTQNRETREITGDTGTYGSFDVPMNPTLLRELRGGSGRRAAMLGEENPELSLGERAYGMAVYEVIQQVRAKGGKVAGNVLTKVDRSYDPETKIMTITVFVTADAIKPGR